MAQETKHNVIIALGTNTDREQNICYAIRQIEQMVTDITCSNKLWTKPIGLTSDKFINMLITGNCSMDLATLTQATKQIEHNCGRTTDDIKSGIVRLDIDILEYDNTKLHSDDWKRDYMQVLLKDIKTI